MGKKTSLIHRMDCRYGARQIECLRVDREGHRMSHTPHELHAEFPEKTEKLHQLKTSNAHFAKLADAYHDVNREIHRIETDVTPTSDEVLETLKKQRLKLKDEIAGMLG
jgi:uncharacterized protein YdcH (DUF465 family)